MWELDGWDGPGRQLRPRDGRTAGTRTRRSAEWWAAAASLRRGGVDRIVVPTPWTRSVEQLVADGVRGEVYAHELVTVPAGHERRAARRGRRARASRRSRRLGLEPVGAYAVAMADDSEALAAVGDPRLADVGRLRAGLGPRRRAGVLAQDPPRPRCPMAAPAAGRRPAEPAAHRPPAAGVRPPPAGRDLMGERPTGGHHRRRHRPPPSAHQRARAVAPAAAPPGHHHRHLPPRRRGLRRRQPAVVRPRLRRHHPVGRADRLAAAGRRRHARSATTRSTEVARRRTRRS